MGDLGNPAGFFTGQTYVVAAFLGEGSVSVNKVEQIEEHFQGIVDLVGQGCRNPALTFWWWAIFFSLARHGMSPYFVRYQT
jgi:hypothetical protein